jgi:hypothetical protein
MQVRIVSICSSFSVSSRSIHAVQIVGRAPPCLTNSADTARTVQINYTSRLFAPSRDNSFVHIHFRHFLFSPPSNLGILRKTDNQVQPQSPPLPQEISPFLQLLAPHTLTYVHKCIYVNILKTHFRLSPKNKLLSPCPISLYNKIKRILLQKSRHYGIYTFTSARRIKPAFFANFAICPILQPRPMTNHNDPVS